MHFIDMMLDPDQWIYTQMLIRKRKISPFKPLTLKQGTGFILRRSARDIEVPDLYSKDMILAGSRVYTVRREYQR